MKKYYFLLYCCMLACGSSRAQDVAFSFANPQITNDGVNDFYEVDVMISTTSSFKLGSGQLYFNYNTAAFGDNVVANSKLEITHPAGAYVLGQKDNWLGLVDVYGDFVSNDNTNFRFSFFWLQSKEGDCLNINVTAAPTPLFHIKIEYANLTEPPSFCFESGAIFDDQTFTHCGPNDGVCGLGDEDCITEPGTQITNDAYDCLGALLPLDLLFFQVNKNGEHDALLKWETTDEINTSHFELERSTEGQSWKKVGKVPASGFSHEKMSYRFLDENVHSDGAPAITYFYRLRMFDLDGSDSYSPVRSVSFEGGEGLSISPNPTSWGVVVRTSEIEEELRLKVFSMDGKLLMEQVVNGSEANVVFPASMNPGVYQLVIDAPNGKRWVERVVKI